MPARRSPSLRTSHENLEQTDMTEPSDGSALEATVESERFDQISITLHWLTALLIIVMFATAWSREAVDHDTRLASALMTAHRTTGVVTWIVGWVRLVWRYNFAYLPAFPESMPKLQQWIAKANEYGLYGLLLAQPISGLGNVLFRGRSFTLFIWEMPALFEANPANVALPMPWRLFRRVVLGPQETRLQLDLGQRRRATTSRVRSMCSHRLPLSTNSSKKTQGRSHREKHLQRLLVRKSSRNLVSPAFSEPSKAGVRRSI
jgi:cytochrome b561